MSRRDAVVRRLWIFLPFLFLPIILYGAVALSSSDIERSMAGQIFELRLLSAGIWVFRTGDAILAIGLICLFAEILKSTSTKSTAIVNHGLSMGLLVICLILFLSAKSFASSVFFLLMLMVLLDVVAGFMVSIVSARRDFGVGDGVVR